METLVSLGTISKNYISHTSSLMLITHRLTKDKRPVVDFILILGNSMCENLSCIDLKDAQHSLRLRERSKEFCGILPYFGTTHFRYDVLSMGLLISPC